MEEIVIELAKVVVLLDVIEKKLEQNSISAREANRLMDILEEYQDELEVALDMFCA